MTERKAKATAKATAKAKAKADPPASRKDDKSSEGSQIN
jgi:hypothetical protein